MTLLRDLGRRKLRTTLTILGITIGIWALVVFGSMANKINALVDGGSDYYADKITVAASGTGLGFGQPMSVETADMVAELPGVAAVVPDITMPMADEEAGMSMSMDYVVGQPAGADEGLETFALNLANGRDLTPADEGSLVTVVGSDLARRLDLTVGDSIELRGRAFEVIGVLEPTLTMPDTSAMVPLAAAQELFIETMPPMLVGNVEASELVAGLTVYPEAGVDLETLAETIRTADASLELSLIHISEPTRQ